MPVAAWALFNPATLAALTAAAEYAAVATAGALVAVGVWEGGKAISNQMSKADDYAKAKTKDVATTDTCTTCDPCKQKNEDISNTRNEIKKRYNDMREDKMDLFNTRPTGPMSWQGHIDQFKQKQKNLRRQLNDAMSDGCKPPDDAWEWASKDAPTQPAPK